MAKDVRGPFRSAAAQTATPGPNPYSAGFRTITVITVAVALIVGLGIELITSRYGQPGYISTGHHFLSLLHVANIAALFTPAVALIHRWFTSRRSSLKRRTDFDQAPVWIPFVIGWILSAFLGISETMPPRLYWESAALVASIALIKFRPSENLGRKLALTTSRILVTGSALTALMFPARAFAPAFTWTGGWFWSWSRLQGVFPQPNTLGWIAALATLVELYNGTRRSRTLFVPVSLVLLFLSGSRTATIALAFGLLVALLVSWRRARAKLPRMAVWATASVAIAAGFFVLAQGDLTLGMFNGRLETWSAALSNFRRSPLIGVGPAASLSTVGDFGGGYAHDEILQVASEMGAIGLLALGLHVAFLIRFVRRQSRGWLGPALAGMWLVMFSTENLLRFADPSFTLQIVLFQLAMTSSALPRISRSGLPKASQEHRVPQFTMASRHGR